MVTRREIIAMVSAAALLFPRATRAQEDPESDDLGPPESLIWRIIVDGATLGPVQLDPPLLPAAPGPIALQYRWHDADKIGAWWQSTLTGESRSKTVVLTASSRRGKPAARYTLDGTRLQEFKGPALTRSGGYDGPSTIVLTYATLRIDPTIKVKKKKRFLLF